MSRTYAALRSAHGQQRVAVLARRRDYLANLLQRGESTLDHDRAEHSALTWALEKLEELRSRLDRVEALISEKEPDLLTAVRDIAAERN